MVVKVNVTLLGDVAQRLSVFPSFTNEGQSGFKGQDLLLQGQLTLSGDATLPSSVLLSFSDRGQ